MCQILYSTVTHSYIYLYSLSYVIVHHVLSQGIGYIFHPLYNKTINNSMSIRSIFSKDFRKDMGGLQKEI